MRRTIAEVADRYGMAPIAASTHPFADWRTQMHTDKERYNVLARDMQVVARRLLICGMHVHVGIEDETLRIDLFNQMPYFLPHLLALSHLVAVLGWRAHRPESYRLTVFNELPRTGLPPPFDDPDEYKRHVAVLVGAGGSRTAQAVVGPAPVRRFPTLEMRITDVCTRLDDAIAVAARYRCLVAHADAPAPRQPALARLLGISHQREPLARPAPWATRRR